MPMTAPYFSLERRLWIPCVLTWDTETGFFERVDGPEGFKEYRTALEASRFLVLAFPTRTSRRLNGG